MKKYTCPNSPEHDGVEAVAAEQTAAQNTKIICAECGEFIDWATSQDLIQIITERTAALSEMEDLKIALKDKEDELGRAIYKGNKHRLEVESLKPQLAKHDAFMRELGTIMLELQSRKELDAEAEPEK